MIGDVQKMPIIAKKSKNLNLISRKFEAQMLPMDCIICIDLLHRVIFILQGRFVSHLDRMPRLNCTLVAILPIPKTVSKQTAVFQNVSGQTAI